MCVKPHQSCIELMWTYQTMHGTNALSGSEEEQEEEEEKQQQEEEEEQEEQEEQKQQEDEDNEKKCRCFKGEDVRMKDTCWYTHNRSRFRCA